jgi:hypothetical protein
MDFSSSSCSVLSYESESTREATPVFDPIAAYKARAPLHWDAEEWDFQTWSEDDESLTDGEDLQFLLDGELDEEDDDDSWDADFFSSEKETSESNEDTDDDSAAGSWLRGWPSEDDEESDDNSGDDNDGDDSDSGDGSSDDGGDDDDNDDDDSSDGASPPAKCRKANGVYWW